MYSALWRPFCRAYHHLLGIFFKEFSIIKMKFQDSSYTKHAFYVIKDEPCNLLCTQCILWSCFQYRLIHHECIKNTAKTNCRLSLHISLLQMRRLALQILFLFFFCLLTLSLFQVARGTSLGTSRSIWLQRKFISQLSTKEALWIDYISIFLPLNISLTNLEKFKNKSDQRYG